VSPADPRDLVGRLTLVYLLLKPIGQWWVEVPVAILAVLGLLLPRLARRPALWWGLTLLSTLRVLHGWTWMDNHAYLLTYWLFAVALSLTTEATDGELATNARYLIGSAFAFAVLWKTVLTTDFLSGDFFHLTLLVDERFRDLGLLVGYLSADQWQANADGVVSLLAGRVDGIELVSGPGLDLVVLASTWWTVILEALVAFTFLGPRSWRSTRARDGLLLLFAWSTYPFATVAGFGWLLMVMGLAQCPRQRRVLRTLYVVTFVGILIMRGAPWASALLALR
jgi:hypothetical protein